MVIPGSKLGLDTDRNVDIIDLKFDDGQAADFAHDNTNIFPGWHMNKRNWITLVLDEGISDEAVFELINRSFTSLLGFAWWLTGVLTTPNTQLRSRLYLRKITLF